MNTAMSKFTANTSPKPQGCRPGHGSLIGFNPVDHARTGTATVIVLFAAVGIGAFFQSAAGQTVWSKVTGAKANVSQNTGAVAQQKYPAYLKR